MQAQPVKINAWIQAGLNLYKENFAVVFTASLIAMLLSMVTFGVLAGPLAAGVTLIVLRLIDRQDPRPEIGDVFKGFDYFLPAFLLFLGYFVASWVGGFFLGLVPVLGPGLSVFFNFALGASVMFAIFLICERQMDAWSAAMASFEIVKSNFWPFFGFYALVSLLSMLGVILCGIGIVVTMPIMVCVVAVAYRDLTGATDPATDESAATDIPADVTEPSAPPAIEPPAPTPGA